MSVEPDKYGHGIIIVSGAISAGMPDVDPLLEPLHEVVLGDPRPRLTAATTEQIIATTTHSPHACYIIKRIKIFPY